MRAAVFSATLAVSALVIVSGCQSTGEPAGPATAVVYADAEAEARRWLVQPLAVGVAPRELGLLGSLGNLQTAATAGLAAATIGSEAGGAAELRLWRLGAEAPAAGRRLAAEWAWDFSLARDGAAIAWIAGAPERQLWVARGPDWRPIAPVLPAGASPSEPRWLEGGRLAVVLRRGAARELAVLPAAGGAASVVYRATEGSELSDPTGVAGTEDVLVIEARDGEVPGRLLRLAAGAKPPLVLAEGLFLPRTLRVAADGRHIGVVTGADAAALRRREAAWRWIGAAWPGLPTVVLGVTAAEWSADGRHLFVARQEGGRRWLEAYDARRPGIAIPVSSPAANATAPQPWLLSP